MRPCHAARVGVLPLVLALGACAAQGDRSNDESASDAEITGQQACFYRRQAQDFQALDRSSLVVFAPTRRNAYLVQVSPPSNELRFADGIAFDSRSNQVCGRAGDALLLGAGALRRYAVVDVRRLEPGQLDTVLASHREGDATAPMEPQTDTAADIEPVESAGDE